MRTRKMVSLQLPPTMALQIEDICEYWHISRSDVIRMALEEYISDWYDKSLRRPDESQIRIEEVFNDGNP